MLPHECQSTNLQIATEGVSGKYRAGIARQARSGRRTARYVASILCENAQCRMCGRCFDICDANVKRASRYLLSKTGDVDSTTGHDSNFIQLRS